MKAGITHHLAQSFPVWFCSMPPNPFLKHWTPCVLLLAWAWSVDCYGLTSSLPTIPSLGGLPVSREWEYHNSGASTGLGNAASVAFCNVEGLGELLVTLRVIKLIKWASCLGVVFCMWRQWQNSFLIFCTLSGGSDSNIVIVSTWNPRNSRLCEGDKMHFFWSPGTPIN